MLSVKYELGVLTREAYGKSDREALKKMVKQTYIPLCEKLNEFIRSFTELWEEINKPFGFEIQQYRLAGLSARLEYCAGKLLEFAAGKTEKIDELEEEVLPVARNADGPICFGGFARMISANKLSW